ncbi:MAG: hypothetical protein QNJ05_10210 [Woeseiaceae bacterium]|nr:hypothetical protein [Woeseiaceae bacterium]
MQIVTLPLRGRRTSTPVALLRPDEAMFLPVSSILPAWQAGAGLPA